MVIASTAFADVSVDNPQDMTTMIINPSFEEGNINGWTTKLSDDTGARANNNSTYHVDNADGNYVFNTWSAGYAITQTIKSMPNGVYKLQGMVTSSDDCTNIYLLANSKHKAITLETSPKTGRKQTYFTTGEIIFYTTNGEVTIGASGCASDGISFANEGEWWYKADNFHLTYYGNEADAWTFALNDYKASVAFTENTVISKSVKEEWENTLNSLTATNLSSYTSSVEAIKKAKTAVDDNIAIWISYIELAEQAENLLKDQTYQDVALDLADYLKYTYQPYLENKNLTTEEVKAEIASLQDLFEESKTLAPAGTDVTSMIVNPDFAKGWDHWSHTGSGTVRADNSAKCAEAWSSSNFDIHQDIENAPVGVYQVKVQGFYRYLRGDRAWREYHNSDGTRKTANVSEYITNTPAKIYINENTSPMANVFDYYVSPEYASAHWTKDDYYTDPNKKKCYPNNMADAGKAFDRGDYTTSVIGLVTKNGDVLRIGMKGNSNQGDDSWAIFTRFKLIYQGYAVSILEPALKRAVNASYIDGLMGSDIVSEINNAINKGNEALKQTEGKKMFNALAAIYAVQNKITNSKNLFTDLTFKTKDFKTTLGKSSNARPLIVEEATKLISEIENAIETRTYTDVQATEAINKMAKLTKQLKVPASIDNASEDNPTDITVVITNNSFETGDLTGWTVAKGTYDTGAKENSNSTYHITNAVGKYVFNTWNSSAISGGYFVSQDIEDYNLPKGKYELTCLVASDQGTLQKVSANKQIKNVVTKNKQTGEKASVIFNLDNNDEKISIKVASTSWFKADDFRLFYYGNGTSHGTSIQDIEAADIAENDIYTPNGIKIQKLKKGLNIVRTNKGVKKIVK